LRALAKERGTSVNAIAEAELTKLIEFDRFADEMEYAVIRKAWLTKLIGYLDVGQIEEFGRWTGVGPSTETIRFYNGRVDLESVIRTYEEVGGKYSRFFKFRHERDDKRHTITLHHGMGRNWSVFYDASLKQVFHDVLGIDLATEVGDNLLIGRFEEPPRAVRPVQMPGRG